MKLEILIQNANLAGELEVPEKASGLVIFVHGQGRGRNSPENMVLAEELGLGGIATLQVNLLTEEEDRDARKKYDVDFLTERLIGVTKWCMEQEVVGGMKIGYLGTNTGSAAALSASAYWGTKISAVVSWGGRPDLAMDELDLIEAPTLLIVGGEDKKMIEYNRKAYIKIGCVKKMEIVSGVTQLSVEEDGIEKVAELALNWFGRFLSLTVAT